MWRYEHGGDIYENSEIQLDFSINTNPLGIPEMAMQFLLEGAEAFSHYPDPKCRALRQALAKKHDVEPETLLCGNGAADLIFRLCAYLKAKKALILAPTFSEYERPIKLFGGQAIEHRLKEEQGFAVTEDILPILKPDIDVVFLCNPNNPTGKLAPIELLYSLSRACAKNGTLFLVDECFIEFTRAASMAQFLGDFPNLLILNAFTKFYGLAGLRLGYLLGEPSLLSKISEFGPEWNVSVAAQTAGLGALEEPNWAERTWETVQAEMATMAAGLSALGLEVFPSATNFLLFKSPHPLYQPLKTRHILVRNCANFTGLDKHFTRIGLKTHEKNVTLLNTIQEALNCANKARV